MNNKTYALHFVMIWVVVYSMYIASTGTTALIVQPLFTGAFAALVAGMGILFELYKNGDINFKAK